MDDKTHTNRLYRDLVCGRQTFGAMRWIITLQRISERHNFAMGANNHDFEGGKSIPFPFFFFFPMGHEFESWKHSLILVLW